MNRHTPISLLCAFIALSATAQSEKTDTIAQQNLDEVVVEARVQHVIDYGVEYIPSKRTKKSAIDATQLLSLMNIPQLDITPGSMTVKTCTGKDVAMFIDYREATKDDLQGLRPEDVLRVEVLQYPQDPRFRGQANVVNFIMHKYDWGGYTKLTATGNTLGVDRADGLLYSKFVKNKWTFDAGVTGSIAYNDKLRGHEVETFRDISVDNRHYDEISRTTRYGKGYLNQNNSQNVSFRATYATESSQIIHSVYYNRSGNPLTRNLSEVEFSDGVFPSSSALSRESGQTLSPAINGSYFFAMPKDNSLIIDWTFTYGSTRRYSTYQLGDLSPIVNNNRESSYAPEIILQYSKSFSHNNTFRTSLMSFNTIYRTRYDGSYDGLQKLLSSENMLFLEYMQNWKCGLSLYSRVGASYVLGRLNGVNTLKQWNPRLGLQLRYKINDLHSASVEGWWGNNHPTPSSSNSAIVQSNELLWLQGNPDLRNTTFITASASYTFIPTNRLSLSATAEYYGFLDKPAREYFSHPGYDGLIRREINSGDFHDLTAYISASLKLFDNSLSLRASGLLKRSIATGGIDSQSLNTITANLQASYFIRHFSFVLYYQAPQKNLSAFGNGVRTHNKNTYGIMVNYFAGDFRAALQFRNWFDDYKCYFHFDSERYSAHGWGWQSGFARSLQLTLSYTLPYGKKVSRNNEIQTSSDTNSAILK